MLEYYLKSLQNYTIPIRVELNDLSFTQRWKDYFIRTLHRCQQLTWYSTQINCPDKSLTELGCVPYLLKLHDALSFFKNNTQYDVGKEFDALQYIWKNIHELDQTYLNLWHRCFTSLATLYFNHEMVIPEGVDKNTVLQYIHDLNGNSHVLERYTYCKLERRTRLFDIPQTQWTAQCMDAHNLASQTNGVWANEFIELIQPGGFDYRTQPYNFSVWLHEDIQGKDQMKAWLDNDDLTQDDIQGNHIMTPNVTFDPNLTYARIIDTMGFRKESAQSGKTIDRYPLGNIIDPAAINWQDVPGGQIEKIVLDELVLWDKNVNL